MNGNYTMRRIHGKLIYHCIGMYCIYAFEFGVGLRLQQAKNGIWNLECRPRVRLIGNREGRDEVSESKLDLAKCKGLNQL